MLLDIQQNLPVFYLLMFFHCIIGTAAAFVAQRKGFNFTLWLVFGLIGGTFAFVTACLLKKKDDTGSVSS